MSILTDITGARIKSQRKSLGLSVEDLAEQLHKAPTSVYRYERCDYDEIPVPIIEALAKCLHVSTAYLMRVTEDPAESPAPLPPLGKIRASAKWDKQQKIRLQTLEDARKEAIARNIKKYRYSKAFTAAFEQLSDDDIHSVLDFMQFLASRHGPHA